VRLGYFAGDDVDYVLGLCVSVHPGEKPATGMLRVLGVRSWRLVLHTWGDLQL
jgi:hypothetical protein